MTYRQLLSSLSALPPESLDMKVMWGSEGHLATASQLVVVSEDQVDDGEGMEPASTYAAQERAEMTVVARAGQPILLAL